MKQLLTLLILIAPALFSCESENKKLFNEVMEAHDTVMPKMGELTKVRKALEQKSAEMAQLDPAMSKELSLLAEEIALANESMMDWMRNFDPNYSGTEEEVKDYMMKKLEGIKKVAEAMNGSLEKGQEALK